MYLNITLIICLLAILNIIFMKRTNSDNIFKISTYWVLMLLILFVSYLMMYKKNYTFQFQNQIDLFFLNYLNLSWGNMILSIDGLSMFFMGLSMILTLMCLLMSFKTINWLYKEFVLFLFMNLIFLILVFSSLDLIMFYMLFESILIPMFMIMGIWGSSNEKVKAAFYFFFYTLIGSLVMLLSLFKIYISTGSTNYENLVLIHLPMNLQFWLFMGFFLSLSVKIPMIPFHIWLPQAHVEAPIAGSVLLAGVLLKLGGYGFMSFSFPLFPLASMYFKPMIMILSAMAMMYGALSTCSQVDMKSLIAYSSVSHMGFVTIGIFTHSIEGLTASILMMLAHGLVSSGLFMSSSILYWSHHSSMIKYFSGVALSMPLFSSFTFMLLLGNISFPLTLNFMGEFLSILSAAKYSIFMALSCCIGAFIGMIYSLYMFNSMFFGNMSSYLSYPSDLLAMEFFSFFPLIILTLLFGMFPNFLIDYLTLSLYFNMTL